MTFLLDNPNRYKQYTYPRRGGGYTAPQITLHTYEAPYTRSLLAAATWLTQRTTPGSYHALVGAKSPRDVLQLAPWSYETWHCVPSNNWAIGISAVMYAHQWKTMPKWAVENIVKSMAYASANAASWLERTHGRKVERRLLTREQAMRKESGFVYHRIMDPGRRTDPANPQRDFPWDMFIAEFNRLMDGGTIVTERGNEVAYTLGDIEQVVRNVVAEHVEKLHRGVNNTVPGHTWTFHTNSEPQSGWTMLRKARDGGDAILAALPGLTARLDAIAEKVGAPAVDASAVAAELLPALSAELRQAVEDTDWDGVNKDEYAQAVAERFAALLGNKED